MVLINIMNAIPICRVCLETSLEYIDFETPFILDDADEENVEYGDTKAKPFTYLDCFLMCTRLEMLEDYDGNNDLNVPQSLCDTCGIELKITFDFLQKAKKAHQILQEAMTKTKLEIIENESMEFEEIQQYSNDYYKNETNCANEDIEENKDKLSAKQERFLVTTPTEEAFELVTVDELYPLSLMHGQLEKVSGMEMVEDTADINLKDGILKTTPTASKLRGSPTNRASRNKPMQKTTPADQRKHRNSMNKALEEKFNKRIELAEVEKNLFQCELCNKCFVNKERLQRHITRERKSKIWLCHACPRTYRDARAYHYHALKHEGKCERNFTCEQCGRKFFRRSTLNDHVKTHETNRQPTFQCDKCDKSFFHRGSLTLHKQSHTGQWIECEICAKRYLRQSDLTIHLRSHSGDLPYKCHKCVRAFAQVGHLNKHLRHHDGYRYKCDVCSKEYMHQSTLIEHYKGHTGLPLKCSICDKGFVKISKIHRHLEVVHKVENTEEMDQFIIKVKTKKVYLWQKGITA